MLTGLGPFPWQKLNFSEITGTFIFCIVFGMTLPAAPKKTKRAQYTHAALREGSLSIGGAREMRVECYEFRLGTPFMSSRCFGLYRRVTNLTHTIEKALLFSCKPGRGFNFGPSSLK